VQIYLSDVQLAERYGVTRPTIWRWSAQGVLPSPVQLSPGCTRWVRDEIEAADAARQRRRSVKGQCAVAMRGVRARKGAA